MTRMVMTLMMTRMRRSRVVRVLGVQLARWKYPKSPRRLDRGQVLWLVAVDPRVVVVAMLPPREEERVGRVRLPKHPRVVAAAVVA